MSKLPLWIAALSLSLHSATAADWNQFRGPTGQGHADVDNLPITWSESENVAWKVNVPGLGWSSPVVDGDRIYLTTAVADGDSQHLLQVLCLAAQDGALIWQKTVFTQPDDDSVEMHEKNSHASPTPLIDGDVMYVHFGPHGTACLDLDGDVKWTYTGLDYMPLHGTGGSPALAGDHLIICCDGRDKRFVAALNRTTGEEDWRRDREFEPSRGFSFSTPLVIEVDGQQQAVCPGSGGVFAYDPKTGEQIWRVNYDEGYSVVPRPVYGHGLVYVCSGFGDGRLFAIDPNGTGDVTDSHVRWQVKKGVPKSPSILLLETEIYMVDDRGVATCLDALTGDVHWQQRFKGGFSASPVFADGRIYFQNETGQTTVIAPGTEYKELGQSQLGEGKERTFASFAFVDSAILLRTEHHLYRLQK